MIFQFLFLIFGIFSCAVAKNVSESVNQSFHLITSLYNEKNIERCKEYIICLEKNLAHPLIATIDVFYDTSNDDDTTILLQYLKQQPITIHYVSDRPSYADCFKLAAEHYFEKPIIIANADIFFNTSLSALQSFDLSNTFIALTRWNVQPDKKTIKPHVKNGKIPITCSQDAWIFLSPCAIPAESIQIGRQHCDGQIAYAAYHAGYKVINPCITVHACHLHLTDIRHWQLEGEWENARVVKWCSLP